MSTLFPAFTLSERTPENNMAQMNALYMSLMTVGVTPSNEDNAIKSYFGDFYVKARFSIENTFDKFLSASPIELRPSNKMEKYVSSLPYTETMIMRAEIPEGLNVPYLTYLGVLIKAQERANKVIENVIRPFEIMVANLITDEGFRNGFTVEVKQFKNIERECEATVKELGACFEKNSYKASATFASVVKRTGDWKEVFSQAKQLRVLYQDFPQSEVTKRLNVLYENLDVLVTQISKDQYRSIEKRTREELANGMYIVAREIELAASTTYSSRVLLTALNDTILRVEEIDRQSKED